MTLTSVLPLYLLSLAAIVPLGIAVGSLVGIAIGPARPAAPAPPRAPLAEPAAHATATAAEDELDLAFADRLVAEWLTVALDLRRECWNDVVREVSGERELVAAWLRHRWDGSRPVEA
jgi:hypothetical protein